LYITEQRVLLYILLIYCYFKDNKLVVFFILIYNLFYTMAHIEIRCFVKKPISTFCMRVSCFILF